MNKSAIKIFVFLLLGVTAMVTCNGCSGKEKYEKYSSVNPKLNITMDYISGWQYRETQDTQASYAGVFFSEPRKKGEERVLKAFISVTSVEALKEGAPLVTLENVAESISGNRLKFKDGKLLGRAKIKLPAGEAADLSFSYRIPDKIYSVDAKMIFIKERAVVLKNGGRFYTVRYENKEEEFGKFSSAFGHIIKSIKFKENK